MNCAEMMPDHLHDHVERQRLAAGLVGRRVVQPALGDDIDPGEGEADDEAHQRPDPGRRRRGIEDERRRDHRGERCEHAHVPDRAIIGVARFEPSRKPR